LKVVPETIVALIRGQTALGRELDPSELAGAAVFLASDDSAPMTGQTLVVDAGHTMLG
jgi:3-oxoacyl-[acyl-carrier protein] reductase